MEHYFLKGKKCSKNTPFQMRKKGKKYNVNSAFFFDEVQSFVINSNRCLVAIS